LTPAPARRTRRALASQLRRWARDNRGVSAIEFSLMAPILIVMFMGMCDLTTAVMVQQHVNQAAEGVADVVSQQTQLDATTTNGMVAMFTAGSFFVEPYSATPLSLRISEIYYNPSISTSAGLVAWSCATGTFTPYTYQQQFTVVPGTTEGIGAVLYVGNPQAAGEAFIEVETSYVYTSPTSIFLGGSNTMTSHFAVEPRMANYVGFPYVTGTTPTAPLATTQSNSVTLSNGASCIYGS